MKKLRLYGRKIVPGHVQGEAVVTSQSISFFGGLDPKEGIIIEQGHELKGTNIVGKILIFPRGKGSTVGSYVIYSMKKNGTAPAAIINVETEPIIAAGCVIADIPLIDQLNENPIDIIKTGDWVEVFADDGIIEVKREG
jgi:predicted aconitase with swiveling domain